MFLHLVICYSHLYFSDFYVYHLPVINPTKYMFTKWSELGKNEDIYTEVCRRIMSEVSNLPLKNDMSYDSKL